MWYEPDRLLPFGVNWLFPAGTVSRFGVASYEGQTRLRSNLVSWLDRDFSLSPSDFHGGFIPYILQAPNLGCVFRVGDSAGQCLPLTGEGIRPALYFGLAAGKLVRRVLCEELSLTQALSHYNKFVMQYRFCYDLLLRFQRWLPHLPPRLTEAVAMLIQCPWILKQVMGVYWRIFDPAYLAPTAVEPG